MFEDLNIRLQDALPIQLGLLCTLKLRERSTNRVDFNWKCTSYRNDDIFIINKKTIHKKKSGWSTIFVSDKALEKDISYFEIEYTFDETHTYLKTLSGLLVGITEDRHTIISAYYEPFKLNTTCVIYNDTKGEFGKKSCVTMMSGANADTRSGDVIGVVVDTIADQIQFYLNGNLIATGIKKPSHFSKFHAFVSLFHHSTAVTLVEKYDYYQLNK